MNSIWLTMQIRRRKAGSVRIFRTGDPSPLLMELQEKLKGVDGNVYVNLFNSGFVIDVKQASIEGIRIILKVIEDKKGVRRK